ncbi:helix-turn-helix domain-containing protein [Maribacter algicola]|nr:AraC family transcriptional regulator [Maribacter algicola]
MELQDVRMFFDKAQHGFRVLEQQKELGQFIKGMEHKNRFDRFLGLLQLLSKLCGLPSQTLSLSATAKMRSLDKGERLQRIFDLVIQNFHRPLPLEEVASLSHMTKNSFCRFFKKHTNKSFMDFLIEYRVSHACQQLVLSNSLSISKIEETYGFQNQSNFNRQFKALKGISPSSYKKSFE